MQAPWLVGGDLNIGRWFFEQGDGGPSHVGVISDCGPEQRDCLFHSPDLPVQRLRCHVGRYFSTAAADAISDAHNVVAAEVLLPSGHPNPPPLVAAAADACPATAEALAPTAHSPVAVSPVDLAREATAADARASGATLPELPATPAPSGAGSSADPPFAAGARMDAADASLDAIPATPGIPVVPSTAAAPRLHSETTPAAAARGDIAVPVRAVSPSRPGASSFRAGPLPTAADARVDKASEVRPPQPLAAAPRPHLHRPPEAEAIVSTASVSDVALLPTAADARTGTTTATPAIPPTRPVAAVARPDQDLPMDEEADSDMDPFRVSLMRRDPSMVLRPTTLLQLLPRPPDYSYPQLAWAYAFDGQEYTWDQFASFYGAADGDVQWSFACRVTHDVHRATIAVTFFRERLQTVADIAPAAGELLATLDQFLIDPRLPPVDMPQRVRHMLLQPLWVRRAALETGGYADAICMPEALCATTYINGRSGGWTQLCCLTNAGRAPSRSVGTGSHISRTHAVTQSG